MPYGRCTFEKIDGAPSLKVHKKVFNPDRDDPLEPGNGSRRFSYEGVLIFCDPLVFILLRNNLTRLPCAYWLHEKEDGILIGHAMNAEFGGTLTGFWPYSKALYFEFHRATGEKRL